MSPPRTVSSVQTLYRSSEQTVRSSFGGDERRALEYYRDLVEFVLGVAPPGDDPARPTRLFDVGCGVGWSTWAFVQVGYQALGLDLNGAAFEPTATDGLALVQGSALDLPCADSSFDVVVTYQCLEHVPDPERALREMLRVCRPGGTVCVVGPNLVSPTLSLVFLAKSLLRPADWPTLRFWRTASMPRHPYGNTVPEGLAMPFVNAFRLGAKFLRKTPLFSMRVPDLVPPFHADNDATYLCNPVDLIQYFRTQGCRILRRGRPGRPPLSYLLAGGTWVAARKPS